MLAPCVWETGKRRRRRRSRSRRMERRRKRRQKRRKKRERRRTVSGKDLGQGAGGLADHDGRVGVVLLHGRVGAQEE